MKSGRTAGGETGNSSCPNSEAALGRGEIWGRRVYQACWHWGAMSQWVEYLAPDQTMRLEILKLYWPTWSNTWLLFQTQGSWKGWRIYSKKLTPLGQEIWVWILENNTAGKLFHNHNACINHIKTKLPLYLETLSTKCYLYKTFLHSG